MTSERPIMVENIDYELIPNDTDGWGIRIMTGEFVETVFSFGELKVDGTSEEPLMSFNFDIISSPDSDLTADNFDLQLIVGDILLAVLESSINNNELETRESK